MRAIGYFRHVDGLTSLRELEEAFYRYCDLNLHQPIKVFGESSPGETGEQLAYHSMLDFMRESGSNFLIVIPDATHLGDDLETATRVAVELGRAGAKVICANDELPDPLQNALQTVGATGVSRKRSDRIKESMRARAMRGQGLGKPPYGYRNGAEGTLEVVQAEAATVELIYRLYTEDGLGLRLIAQHLNEGGIPTRRGGNWNMVTIRDILRNPAYIGTYTRFGLRVPKAHEAIMSPDVFRAAQDRARARRRPGRVANSEPFLLSGLVYCGYCGNKMMGVTRRQSWRRKDGRRAQGVYRYYQCQSRNNQSVCGYHTWRAYFLESTVLTQLKSASLAGAHHLDGTAGDTRKEQAQAMWNGRVINAERRFLQAMRRAARGELSIAILGDYLDELDKVRLRASSPERGANTAETLAGWDSIPIAERQSFLMEHVTRIVVRDESVQADLVV